MKISIKTMLASMAVTTTGLLLLVPMISLAGNSFFIDHVSGYVGIGNTTPQHRLDVSGAMYSRLITATSSSINWNAGNIQALTLSSNLTLAFSNGQAGGEYKLILNQDSAGGKTVTWPASVKWTGGNAPVLSTSANAIDVVSFLYDGSNYLGSFTLNHRTASILPNGIVAYWKLDGNSVDSTSSGHNGTDVSATYSSLNGKINNGVGFVASNSSHITLTDSSAFHNSNFTTNFWLKTSDTNVAHNAALFQVLHNVNSHLYGFESFISAGGGVGHVQFGVGKGTGQTLHTDYDEITGSVNVADGNWHMITLWYDGSTIKIYVDGILDNSDSWTGGVAYNTVNYATIGELNQTGTGTNYGDTAIDEVGLWNRALTTAEMSELYNSGSGLQYSF